MTDVPKSPGKRYTIVLRCAESAIRMAQGQGLRIVPIATSFGEYDLKIVTRTEKVAAFDTPLPRELWVEVSGNAPTLQDAANIAYALADEYVRIAAFATNAWQGLLEFHLGFDSSAEGDKREFHQNWVFDEQGLVRPARNVNPGVAIKLFEAYARLEAGERNRILRAIFMYTDSLQFWKHGGEIHALAHLYMGVEAITPLVVMGEVRRRGLKNREELDVALHGAPADSWKLRWATWLYVKCGGRRGSQLDAWIRREIIFKGDANTYKAAKGASDKWEHATDDRARIHQLASASLSSTANYLRSAILDILPLESVDRQALASGEFSTPASTLGYQRWVSGLLNSSGKELAAPDQAYPILRWEFTMKGLNIGERGRYEMTVNQKLTPMLGSGVTITLDKLYFSGPEPMQHDNVEVKVQRGADRGGERIEIGGQTGPKFEVEIDAPANAKWVHPYGSFLLNSNVFFPLSEFWLSNMLGVPPSIEVRRTLRENVTEILSTLEARGISADLIGRCAGAWKEAIHIDEAREVLAVARTTPEGLLSVTRGRSGMQPQSVIDDVGKLVTVNEHAVAAARNVLSLADELNRVLDDKGQGADA
jgi:hypothetical protein